MRQLRWKLRYFFSRCGWSLRHRWYRTRVFWYRTDKGPLISTAVIGAIIGMFGFGLRTAIAHRDDQQNLLCLARNVYFEARGEPKAGQIAVAEVTMNRLATGRYASTLCGVVYQKNWDPLRKRYVGAFSWTEFDEMPQPTGEDWLKAWRIAESVYYRKEAPVTEGALFYHATYIQPDWAKEKRQVAKIGGHIYSR
jgi:N-acetylmuramoyl-L-alanine amidase